MRSSRQVFSISRSFSAPSNTTHPFCCCLARYVGKSSFATGMKEYPGNGFNLKVFSDTLKKYADELGLEFGDVYYYLVVEDDKADEMGVRV